MLVLAMEFSRGARSHRRCSSTVRRVRERPTTLDVDGFTEEATTMSLPQNGTVRSVAHAGPGFGADRAAPRRKRAGHGCRRDA